MLSHFFQSMLLQYCFNDAAKRAYNLSHKIVLKSTVKAYASKLEALRSYAQYQGFNAPAHIFDHEIIQGHLEQVKAQGKLSQGYIAKMEAALRFICKLNNRKDRVRK